MIECLKCGGTSPPGQTRCRHCGAFLPVTVSFQEGGSRGRAESWRARRAPQPPPEPSPDYSRERGGSTLIHAIPREEASGRGGRGGSPFDLEPLYEDEDEEVFTSAEPLEPPPIHRRADYRSGRLVDGDEEDGDDLLPEPSPEDRYRGLEPAAPPSPPPLPPVASAPPPMPPPRPPAVTYIPGRGLVPQAERSEQPTRPLAAPSPATARSGVMAALQRLQRPPAPPAPPAPPPGLPTATYTPEERTVVDAPAAEQSAAEELERPPRIGSSGSLSAARSSGALPPVGGMPPRPAAPTVVAPAPPQPARPLGRPASRHAELEEQAETGKTRLERDARVLGRVAVLDGRGEVVRSVPLRSGRTVVGRGEGDVTLDDDLTISPGHASLEARDGGVFVRDLRSRNGVYRRLRGDHMLADGDALMLGEQRFTFQASWGEDDADAEGTVALGAPGYDAGARLLHWRRGGQLCGVYLLREGITVGRSRGDVTFPQDSGLDAEHAVFRQLGERYGLIDLGSRRGIFLRLAPGEAHRLEDGDELMLGQTRLRYLQSDEAS